MARCAIYARVSTTDQHTEMQLTELTEYASRRGFDVVGQYVDEGVSGAKKKRPELDRLMQDARKRKFNVVLVWRFDRFARSLGHLVAALDEFQQLGIEFISQQEAADTTTSQGKLMFHLFGAMAEFERELIRERVKAGMKSARDRKIHCGRPALSDQLKRKITDMRKLGLPHREIAKMLEISVGTVCKYTKGMDTYCRDDRRRKKAVVKRSFADKWCEQEGPQLAVAPEAV